MTVSYGGDLVSKSWGGILQRNKKCLGLMGICGQSKKNIGSVVPSLLGSLLIDALWAVRNFVSF